MRTPEELISEIIDGAYKKSVDERSLILAPPSDASNTASNLSTLLEEAFVQFATLSQFARDVRSFHLNSALKDLQSDLLSSKRNAEKVLKEFLKYM
jgi:hypothetical protein